MDTIAGPEKRSSSLQTGSRPIASTLLLTLALTPFPSFKKWPLSLCKALASPLCLSLLSEGPDYQI